MSSRLFIIPIIILFSIHSTAQYTTKIYYDENWKVLENHKKAECYRIINFDSAWKPINPVKIYFMNGKLRSESYKSYVDTNDISKDTIDGIARIYSKNGKLITEWNCEKGLIHGDLKYWYETGQQKIVSHYEHGYREGEYISYHPNGNYQYKLKFVHGAIEGLKGSYYTTRFRKQETFFDDFTQPKDPYNWKLPEGEGIESKIIQNSGLFLKNNSKDNVFALLELPFNSNKGFDFAVYIKRAANKSNTPYGMIYNYSDENNFSYFIIRPDGSFLTGQKSNGKEIESNKWMKTKMLSKKNEADRLSVYKYKEEMYFYINSKKVFTGKYYPITGKYYGVICGNEGSSIKLQFLSINQW